MEYREIKISQLADFIKSDIYQQTKNIPITRQRAISQLGNPRADEEDVILIIAIDEKKRMVGYIGALPDHLQHNPEVKFAWNSCWWVDPRHGKSAALPLFLRFATRWKNVMFRELTPHTKEIIEKLNKFHIVQPIKGTRFFLRMESAEILPRKNKLFLLLKPLLYIGDYVFNAFTKLFFGSRSFNILKNTQIKEVRKLDSEAADFVRKLNQKELIGRGKSEINWILAHPWVLRKSLMRPSQYYYFSDTSDDFRNHLVKIYSKDNTLSALIFITEKDGLVKIPYAYYKKKNIDLVVSYIYKYVKESKAISFVTFNPDILKFIEASGGPFWHKKEIQNELVVSKPLKNALPSNFKFQDGEGDFVFT